MSNKNLNTPNNVIRNARIEKELTLEKVSEKTGIPISTINAWERGAAMPYGKNRMKIAKFYGISEDLLKREQPSASPLADYETRALTLHKNDWAIVADLLSKFQVHDHHQLVARLLAEAKSKSA